MKLMMRQAQLMARALPGGPFDFLLKMVLMLLDLSTLVRKYNASLYNLDFNFDSKFVVN